MSKQKRKRKAQGTWRSPRIAGLIVVGLLLITGIALVGYQPYRCMRMNRHLEKTRAEFPPGFFFASDSGRYTFISSDYTVNRAVAGILEFVVYDHETCSYVHHTPAIRDLWFESWSPDEKILLLNQSFLSPCAAFYLYTGDGTEALNSEPIGCDSSPRGYRFLYWTDDTHFVAEMIADNLRGTTHLFDAETQTFSEALTGEEIPSR